MSGWVGRLGAVAGGLVCGAVAACAPSGPPPPVCGDPVVLQRLDETLRAQSRPLFIQGFPVGELSTTSAAPASSGTAPPPTAQCAVRASYVAYDTNRYGLAPIAERITVRYAIEMRHNGLFIRLL